MSWVWSFVSMRGAKGKKRSHRLPVFACNALGALMAAGELNADEGRHQGAWVGAIAFA